MAAVDTYKENYATGDVVSALQFNNVNIATVAIFSTTSQRDSLNSSPEDGQLCIVTADDTIYQYRNSAWVSITNINDQVLSKFNAKDYTETTATLTSSSGVVSVDLENGNVGTLTLTENVTDIDFTNVPTSGLTTYQMYITQDSSSSYTVAINAITVNGGSDVTAKTAKNGGFSMTATNSVTDIVSFAFIDAGTPLLTALQDMRNS
jgi:hypothetical protein